MAVALKGAAVQSRADQPAVVVPAAEAGASQVDPRAAVAPEAAVAQFRADRPALEGLVAEAAAFPGARPAAAVQAAVEVVCPALVAFRYLDPRSCQRNHRRHKDAVTVLERRLRALKYRDCLLKTTGVESFSRVHMNGIAKIASLDVTCAANE